MMKIDCSACLVVFLTVWLIRKIIKFFFSENPDGLEGNITLDHEIESLELEQKSMELELKCLELEHKRLEMEEESLNLEQKLEGEQK